MRQIAKPRNGMSIAELLIGMVILAIVGMGLTKVMSSQARYFDHQKTSNLARAVSRGPLNRVVSDLRMVEAAGGVMAASASSVTMRVPYAIGVVCGPGPQNNYTHISLLPVDSAMYSGPGYSGYAWRGGDGVYHYVDDNNTKEVGNLTVCNGAQVTSLTTAGARIIRIIPKLDSAATVGTPVFLYRNITYSFAPSTSVPGTTGLFRTRLEDNFREELSAPYDQTAKFRFYVGSNLTPSATPPSNLATMRGLEMNMTGLSERTPTGSTQKKKAPFVTAVFFKNRLN